METFTATIIEEGQEKVIRLPAAIPLVPGCVVCKVENDGEIVITPMVVQSDKQKAWIEFLDHLASRPRDPEFMKERPMNRMPVERNLFPEDEGLFADDGKQE